MSSSIQPPKFLTVDDVLLLHAISLDEFGGQAGIRDSGLLNSAVAQPQAGISSGYLHTFPFEMAAAYGFHLAKNHPFLDGNKRVAWSAIRAFLERNGYVLRSPTVDNVRIMLGVADGTVEKAELTNWITDRAKEKPRLELRDFLADISFAEFADAMVAIAKSYRSGGSVELTAIVNDCGDAIPLIAELAIRYETDRENNEPAIHYLQTLCAIVRIAKTRGYEW